LIEVATCRRPATLVLKNTRVVNVYTHEVLQTDVAVDDGLIGGLGMRVLIRDGSAARNLTTLIEGVDPHTAHLCAFCTDDKQPADLIAEGHIDYNLRTAVAPLRRECLQTWRW
jgi:adenine deaminase